MIKIGKRKISSNSKPLIVAEVGINHFGSLKLAKKIVDQIKKCGAEAVKVDSEDLLFEKVAWSNSTGTLVLTIATGQSVAARDVVFFKLKRTKCVLI